MSDNQPVAVGLLGLGTVGCGVCNVLAQNAAEIERRTGRPLRVTHASARDVNKQRPVDLKGVRFSTDPAAVVNDEAVDVVVELIGGHQPACELIERALHNGKHVVTANKALIAVSGNRLFEAARTAGVALAYEASVAGGIPIVKMLREGLAANRIERVIGIVNGTTNFVLTEVSRNRRPFSDALTEAQRLGYAEADPGFDIDGIDAAHKMTILASIAFGVPLQYDKVHVESAAAVELRDVDYAKELGYCIKHLGIAKRCGGAIELRVHPALIPLTSLLADVNGVMNAVEVDGNAVGPTLCYGAGAGAGQTASAVIADLIDVVRTIGADPRQRVPALAFQPGALASMPVVEAGEVVSAHYLRLQVEDRPGVLTAVTEVLSSLGISIEAVLQKEPADDGASVPLILLTHPVKGTDICTAIGRIERFDTVLDPVVRYRMEPA